MFDLICTCIEDIFETGRSQIQPLTTFESDLFADLQDMQELFMMIEEEFDVVTDEADIASIVTVQDLCDYVKALDEKKRT